MAQIKLKKVEDNFWFRKCEQCYLNGMNISFLERTKQFFPGLIHKLLKTCLDCDCVEGRYHFERVKNETI